MKVRLCDYQPEITIKRWFADFKRGRVDSNDAIHSGRPNEAVTPENNKNTQFFILHEQLSIRKPCLKWVPCLPTVAQKQQRIDDSEQCLTMFNRNKPELLRRYVTMDES